MVLKFLAAEANCWSSFVGNCVAKTQENKTMKWCHFGTHGKLTDIASRGMGPLKLKTLHCGSQVRKDVVQIVFANSFSLK